MLTYYARNGEKILQAIDDQITSNSPFKSFSINALNFRFKCLSNYI